MKRAGGDRRIRRQDADFTGVPLTPRRRLAVPVNLEQLEGFLIEEGLEYQLSSDGDIAVRMATTDYAKPDGEQAIHITIRAGEEGTYIEMAARSLYDAKTCRYRERLFETVLAITMRNRLIRFEYDPLDGTIGCGVEAVVEDGRLTSRQWLAMIRCLTRAIDRWDGVIRTAMYTGHVSLEPVLQERSHLARLAAIEEAAGGIEELEAIVRQLQALAAADDDDDDDDDEDDDDDDDEWLR